MHTPSNPLFSSSMDQVPGPKSAPKAPWALAMLVLLAACGGGGGGGGGGGSGGGGGGGGSNNLNNVLFQRPNASGGSDLFRAPVDGSTSPVAITNNGTRTIDEILNGENENLVNGRVIYKGTSSPTSFDPNFYSVTTQSGATPAQLTNFTTSNNLLAYGLVGTSLIVRATSGIATTDLWAVPVDGSRPARNLTNLGVFETANWDVDQVVGTRIFYEVTRATTAVRDYFVFDTAGAGGPVRVGPTTDILTVLTNDATLALAPESDARYLASGSSLFLRVEQNFGSTFQLFEADMVTGALTPMSDVFTTATGPTNGVEPITGGFIVSGHFCYLVDSNQQGTVNLFAADFNSATPSFRDVTDFPAGSTDGLAWKAFVPSQPKVVMARAAGVANVQTDLYVVDVAADTKLRILDGSILGAHPAVSDIDALTVLGSVAVFERARATETLWAAPLDGSSPAGTELLASFAGARTLDGFMETNQGSGRAEMFGADPSFDFTTLAAQQVYAQVARTQGADVFSDLFVLSANGNAIQSLRLTAQTVTPDGFTPPFVVTRAGNRVVYLRSFQFFSATVDASGAELRITDVLGGIGSLTPSRLLYVATNGNLYSAPYDRDFSSGQVRALTALPGGSSIHGGFLYPTQTKVVFMIDDGNGNIRIVSSDLVPSTPTITDISRTTGTTDEIVLLF